MFGTTTPTIILFSEHISKEVSKKVYQYKQLGDETRSVVRSTTPVSQLICLY